MPLKKVYQDKMDSILKEIEKLLGQFTKAGAGSKGDIEIKIEELEEKYKLFQSRLEKTPSKKSPKEAELTLFVFSDTTKGMKDILGELFEDLYDGRYDESEIKNWKPFKGGKSIQDLLEKLKSKYPIKNLVFKNQLENKTAAKIGTILPNSLSIVDLLSVSDKNRSHILKFDSHECGLIFPLCRSLSEKLVAHAKATKKSFITISASGSELIACDFYSGEVSDEDAFLAQALKIFKQKGQIQNQVSEESPVRDISISF